MRYLGFITTINQSVMRDLRYDATHTRGIGSKERPRFEDRRIKNTEVPMPQNEHAVETFTTVCECGAPIERNVNMKGRAVRCFNCKVERNRAVAREYSKRRKTLNKT